MNKLFISYARKDEPFARQLATLLSESGADIWLDVEDIPGGMKWSSAIQQGLDAAEGMILILSSSSLGSRNVEDEWQYYLDKNKPIFPVLIEKVELPYQINRVQWVDFSNPQAHFLESYRKLLTALNAKGFTLGTAVGAAPFHIKTAAAPASTPSTAVSSRPLPLTWIAIVAAIVIVALIIILSLLNGSNPPATSLTTTPSDTQSSAATPIQPEETANPSPAVTQPSAAAEAQITAGALDITITHSNKDSLTILVTTDTDFTGLAIETTSQTIPITDYFDGLETLNFQVKTGSCLRFIAEGKSPPLPRACDREKTFVQELSSSEVFWYDTVTNQPVNFSLLQNGQSLGICSAAVAAASGCKFSSS